MNYAAIRYHDIANGPGVRISLFVSGCRNHCPGCFNTVAWDFSYGQPYTAETEDQIAAALASPFFAGLSLLGGDPFEPENERALISLARRTKKLGKTVWCWTGYLMEDLKDRPLMEFVDVLIDGPYESGQNSLAQWRGSSNQRIWRKEADGWSIMQQ